MKAAALVVAAAVAAGCSSYHRTGATATAPKDSSGRRTTTMGGGTPAQTDTTTGAAEILAGDWSFSGDLNQQPANGTWNLDYAAGRWTGTVTLGSYPPAPVTAMSVKGMDATFGASIVNQDYRFNCHVETPQTASCVVTTLSTSGRIVANKRG